MESRLVELNSTETSIEHENDEKEEIYIARASIAKLSADLDKENERKANLLNELKQLREKIDNKEGANGAVQKLMPLLESLKGMERREFVMQSYYDAKKSKLEAEVCELEDKWERGWDSEKLYNNLECALANSLENLTSVKKELAGRLREVMSIKRKIDDIPIQSELIQYERRLSELNAHIQEKHRQTRKYYATYNALLEIKELMLKETSLLNSISSQFQDAIISTDGRMKLINSMEGIVKGSQQKLQKVQVGLQEEQKACDALKKRYAAAMAEQRRCYSLLKAFQEECAKNERLQSQNFV
ncbi:coiled-coil domain-containing protein 93 [Ricinus communis]|uniref:coiled-coil domain-containing protein 93 n=1 Tax=Ricinus communis TaxID=3988 RepID=UPI00201A7778|nr:coiled-coil domain-containing protein 93 [Ricinus communis]